MEREIKTASDGYLFTEIAEVELAQRTWAKTKDTTMMHLYHEVPIAEYEQWQQDMEVWRKQQEEARYGVVE